MLHLRDYQQHDLEALREWFIYVLKDPRDNSVRYVGWTKNPKLRLTKHIWCKDKNHKQHWINSLIAAGVRPTLEVIESGAGVGYGEAERRWIAFYRQHGARLTNGTDGGEGSLGLRHTEEAKRKSSESHRGKKLPLSDEERKRRAQQGIANLISSRAKRVKSLASRVGKFKMPPHVREAIINAPRYIWNEQDKQAARERATGRRHSPVSIEKMVVFAKQRQRGTNGKFA